MVDVDALAGTKNYFAKANWRNGGITPRAVAKCVKALDGRLVEIWNSDDDGN